jgi:hypothetical protein
MHAARLRLIAGEAAPAPPAAGSRTGSRPSHIQARLLGRALDNADGEWELSGYRFNGDAQRRAAMQAMAGETRRWFVKVRDTEHGTLYRITAEGRAAFGRYAKWMGWA